MDILIHPTYFPNVAHFVGFINADNIVFEIEDNFQKQTYRNRCLIYAANGILALNIPVIYSQKNRKKYKDVTIANSGKWQSNHWKSLQSAYNTSPFFEFYKDEIAPLFETEFKFVMDFNINCLSVIFDCLQLELTYKTSEVFDKLVQDKIDLRYLVEQKKESKLLFDSYTQVFSTKYGYFDNLSILDLLFNEGPNTLNYLQSQDFEKLRKGNLG